MSNPDPAGAPVVRDPDYDPDGEVVETNVPVVPGQPNVYTAIIQVMQNVGYVRKQRGANLNYTYAGESALISAIRPEMVEAGLFCYVKRIWSLRPDVLVTNNDKRMNRVTLMMTVRFVHAPSGTHIDVQTAGEGADSGDKSQNKALTGAYKYALRETFCIETGDDPDAKHLAGVAVTGATQAAKPEARRPQPARPDAVPGVQKGAANLKTPAGRQQAAEDDESERLLREAFEQAHAEPDVVAKADVKPAERPGVQAERDTKGQPVSASELAQKLVPPLKPNGSQPAKPAVEVMSLNDAYNIINGWEFTSPSVLLESMHDLTHGYYKTVVDMHSALGGKNHKWPSGAEAIKEMQKQAKTLYGLYHTKVTGGGSVK